MTGSLEVLGVDPCVEENGHAHRTWDYSWMEKGEDSRLVVRRGQSFDLQVKTDREFNAESDLVVLVFTVQDAAKPNISRGTQIVVPVETKDGASVGGLWKAEVLAADGQSLLVQVTTSPNCIVGPWTLEIDTRVKGSAEAGYYRSEKPIYVLFNPWCKDDSVFLEDETQRTEYVLGESGIVYRGTASQMRASNWNFSQFEDPILDTSIWILWNVAKLPPIRRNDPIEVVRAISAAVNHEDDNGIMQASWSGQYEDGTAPTKWTGSLDILQRYWNTKKPVRYGQCFNFGALVTTICRTLGIPCRPVTNYESAHDSQGSLTVDVIVDDEGNPVTDKISDSVWNYHVWNEVWMTRPDLEPGDYSGWQVIDGTPQEASEGVFRCGPASIKAVKRGEIKKHYDTSFVFAEVNADRVFWKEDAEKLGLKFLHKRTDDIGIRVVTKAVGKFELEEITDHYKFKDDSVEEREVMLRALRQAESQFTRIYLNEHMEDVTFKLRPLDDMHIGETIKFNVGVKNKNPTKPYSFTATLRIDSIEYTGKTLAVVKKQTFEMELPPMTKRLLSLNLPYRDYSQHLAEQGTFNIACIAKVHGTEYEYFAQDDFRVHKPQVQVQAPEQVVLGDEFPVHVSIKNPLPINLVSPRFVVEGAGMGEQQKSKLTRIPAGGSGEATFTLVAKHVGEKTISAKFWARDLQDCDGFCTIQVVE